MDQRADSPEARNTINEGGLVRSSAKNASPIHAYISPDSEEQANQVIDRILSRGDQLAAFPRSGRTLRMFNRTNVREIIEKPYRIMYRVRDREGRGYRSAPRSAPPALAKIGSTRSLSDWLSSQVPPRLALLDAGRFAPDTLHFYTSCVRYM